MSIIDADVTDRAGGVLALRRELDALRKELHELRRQLAAEVRTRSVVVVDETGREGVTIEATTSGGAVTLHSADHPDSIVSLAIDEASHPGWLGLDVFTAADFSAASFGLNVDLIGDENRGVMRLPDTFVFEDDQLHHANLESLEADLFPNVDYEADLSECDRLERAARRARVRALIAQRDANSAS